MCTSGYIYYRSCGHLVGPTHFPCRGVRQPRCAGARPNGVEFGPDANNASQGFLEVCAPCYACHFVRDGGPDGAYRPVRLAAGSVVMEKGIYR
ncbi:hypothetical protein F5X96DRAFT_668200 [Biscogniauxia mediterranea]|nr:hypothetical protein F5X96DRAFT_668200 [Biscogniauxia mediterranea]